MCVKFREIFYSHFFFQKTLDLLAKAVPEKKSKMF